MVMKVVRPAAISVFTLVLRSLSLNIFSNIFYTSFFKFSYIWKISVEFAVVQTVADNKVIGDGEK